MKGTHLWLLAAVLLSGLLAVPSFFPGEYGGADGAAEEVLVDAGHSAWFSPVYEPPSGEVASLLFAVQAAVGGLLAGYYIGLLRGRA